MKRFVRLSALALIAGILLVAVSALTPSTEEIQARELASVAATSGMAPSVPGQFLTGPNAGAPLEVALSYLNEHQAQLGLVSADLAGVTVSNQYVSQHNGVTHIYLQQTHDGITVYGGLININIAGDGSVINMGNRFVPDLASVASGRAVLSPEAAVRAAAAELGLLVSKSLVTQEARGGAARAQLLSDGGISQNPIPARLVYQPVENGARLAWDVEIYELNSLHYWSIRMDAESGELLSRVDYVINEASGEASRSGTAVIDRQLSELQPESGLSPDSYTVLALPKEHPNDGPRTTELDPADATASPFGWHDTNGSAGAEFTRTQGNNVHAYADTDANNLPDPGSDPDGGPGLVFSDTLDLSLQPASYISSAVTNLFYWNNIMHDVMYLYGFDEPAGNFQQNNYGNGGLGGDYVNGEAQDGSGVNNANFLTPSDGQNGRMQMFVFTLPLPNLVIVNPPSPLAGDYAASSADFGPALTATGPITGDLSLANDGTAPDVTDACQSLTGFPAGNIALVRRGGCNFVIKVNNAQAAGATAVIVMNNVAGDPITMGGADPTIVIPSVMISQSNGDAFQAELVGGGMINATLNDAGTVIPNRDADLDNGVIVHEYGHGISTRLTGGPSQVGCLLNDEQMGEGWSDLFTLLLHADAADQPTDGRGVGTYVLFQPPDGVGIRPTPYTTDLSVNPSTYADISSLAIPHGVGYAWASMVWEMYWNLVEKHGFNPDIYGDWATGGNNLTLQLLLDGLKLQPCSPGFVDGRDAILAADMALTGGANQCEIWLGFARRGLGFHANQGSSLAVGDETEAFDIPLVCPFLSAAPPSQDICAGDSVDFIVSVGPQFTAPPVEMGAGGEPSGATVNFTPNPVPSVPLTTTMNISTTSGLSPGGLYSITITATDSLTFTVATVNLTLFDTAPAGPTLVSPSDGATGEILHPSYAWMAVSDATSYIIEVATDIAFSNIVEAGTVVGTSYTSSVVLSEGATYYWRVRAANLCGETDSTVSSFSTVSASCSPGDIEDTVYREEFESGGTGWTHTAPTGANTWTITNTNTSPGSGGFAFYAEDLDSPADQRLVSPPISLPANATDLTLQFLNEQFFQDPDSSGGCWDGSHLEISDDGGATWASLDAELQSDPYDGISSSVPTAPVALWCGMSQGDQPWLNSIVDLDAYAGKTVNFRWRMLSDSLTGDKGWYLDDVTVTSCADESRIYLPSILSATGSTFSSQGEGSAGALPQPGLVILPDMILNREQDR